MKNAAIFGAGNIGRGFIGHLLYKSGYRITFIDVDILLVNRINEYGEYPVVLVDNETSVTEWVCHVSAVNGRDIGGVAATVADADILATAVGVNNLKYIAHALAIGLSKRIEEDAPPVNIIVCENKLGANRILSEIVAEHLPENQTQVLDAKVGFVGVSVGRMVPTPAYKPNGNASVSLNGRVNAENPLVIRVEPYSKLPFDKNCCRGESIDIIGGIACESFDYYIRYKLFIHNLGHAITAYLGFLKGYEYIHEAAADENVKAAAFMAMNESAQALKLQFPEESAGIDEDILDLTRRFGNSALCDPIIRVCGDPLRKLGYSDRLIGSMRNCESLAVDCPNIYLGIGAALLYNNLNDENAVNMQAQIAETGIDVFLREHCGIGQSNSRKRILEARNTLSG